MVATTTALDEGTFDKPMPNSRYGSHVETTARHASSSHCDPLLHAQQGAPRRFGRVRGQHGLEADAAEHFEYGRQFEAGGLERRETLLEAARLGHLLVTLVLPAPAHPMDLFRRVHHLEPCGERTNHVADLRCRATLGSHHQRDRVLGLALAAADRGNPVTFYKVEDFVAALVPHHLADHAAERVHVLAQRGVLGWEKDAFAGHGGRIVTAGSG